MSGTPQAKPMTVRSHIKKDTPTSSLVLGAPLHRNPAQMDMRVRHMHQLLQHRHRATWPLLSRP